ncbi:MAG: ABC transporter substrate-binding protein [Firmicutes bacterium]|nr:ABC transporter substrate-binding protein [Bacillota bacterium]
MNKSIKRSFVLALLVSSLILTSCGNTDVSSIFTGETVEIDNTVHIAAERVETLNPLLSFDEQTIQISKLVYSSLFTFDENLIPKKELTDDYSYSEDGKSIDILIRDDVYWHDGEKLTGEDVKFTVETIKSLSNYGETLYTDYVSNIRTVKVDSDNPYLITFTFGYDVSKGLENFTFPVFPSHLYSSRTAVSEMRSDKTDFIPVGTGKYKVSEYNRNKSLTLVSNEDYFGKKPQNSLVFEVLPDIATGINLTDTAAVSLVLMTDYERETYITDKELNINNFPSNETELIGFNMYGVHTSNKYFRKGIASLVDNSTLFNSVYYENGYLTDSILYPGYYGTIESGDAYPYDKEYALECFKKAGYQDRDNDGYLENQFNEDIYLSILVDVSDETKCKTANIIRDSLIDAGIRATVDATDQMAMQYKIEKYEYNIFIGTATISEKHDLRSLLHSNYGNPAGYSDEIVNGYLEKLIGNISVEDKKIIVNRLEEKLKDALPYYPILCKSYGLMSINEFDGELAPMFNNIYSNSEEWRIEKKFEKN